MITGTKFWKIKPTTQRVDYSPHANQGVKLHGIVKKDPESGIQNMIELEADDEIKQKLETMLSDTECGIGISDNAHILPHTQIIGLNGNLVVLNQGLAYIDQDSPITLVAWNLDYPSVRGADAGIRALLCINSSHDRLVFIDNGGRKIEIPAGTLVKGAIYYFCITNFLHVGKNDFIGIANS